MKRQRSPSPSSCEPWTAAVAWIRSCSGVVHPALDYDRTKRVLQANSHVAQGTVLLRVPQECLVTLDTAKGLAPVRQMILRAVLSIPPNEFHFTQNDVALAFLVAAHSMVRGSGADSFFEPYWKTLPANAAFDDLPRRWAELEQDRLLAGSPAHTRAKRDRSGLASDHALVAKAYDGPADEIPPVSLFDWALAVVSSRAFAEVGHGDVDALVPLLDLADHQRGRGPPDLKYARAEDGFVEVVARVDVAAGAPLRDTYGAKSNGQLFCNYGFCLDQNIEPDGSSNDVFELMVGTLEIVLRTGPKSYTFGPFSKGVDALRDKPSIASSNASNAKGAAARKDAIARKKAANVLADISGLRAFAIALEAAMGAFALRGELLDVAKWDTSSPRDRFSAFLVASEQRTLSFVGRAVAKTRALLIDDELKDSSFGNSACAEVMLEEQSQELADVFIKIRHPHMLKSA